MAAHPPAFNLLDSAAPLMKRYYDDRRVYSMTYKNRPLYAWMPKKTGVVGEAGGYRVPVTIDDIPGESADFASAVAARDGDTHEVWALGRVKRYGTATIDWETVRAMKSDMGAFMRAIKPRIDSAINQLSNSAAYFLYQNGTGSRGVIAGINNNTLTLEDEVSVRALSIRRTIEAASDEGGTGADNRRTGTNKIIGLSIAGKTVELAGPPDASWAIGDFLFPLGDYSTTTTTRAIDGLGGWMPLPSSITTGDDWKGVDRSVYKEKLLGLDFDATTGAIDANIRQAAAELQANEGSPDALFLNPVKWAELETALASQSRYEMMMGSDARTGFDSIVINAGGGKVNVVADPWCPLDRGYLLQRDTWELFSIDRYPDFVSEDGNRLHRLENADEIEFRIGGYSNVACRAPGHNSTIRFA